MTTETSTDIPDVSEILGPLLARVATERQPLLLAIAERMAADRYRGWAASASDEATRDGLLACALREEEIAGLVEALGPDSAAIQDQLRAEVPEIGEINRSVFAERPIVDQYAIQAQGERLGAATWRAFADAARSQAVRETLLACAKLEEQSAEFLESLIAGSRARQ